MKAWIKKTISALTAVMLLLACTVQAANFDVPEDAAGTDYADAARMLTALHIMDVDENGAFDGNAPLTRAQFAQTVVRLLGLEQIQYDSAGNASRTVADDWEGSGITAGGTVAEQIQYQDVPQAHWAYQFIEAASRLGFMSGDADGRFMPDANIMYQDAAVVLVKLMGFGPEAEYSGGYPSGYIKTAVKYELRMTGSPTAAITRGQLANLVYDALQADMNVQVGFGGDRIYRREKGHTMLTEYQKLRRAYGTVSGTLYTGLAAPGEKAAEGHIRIDGLEYTAAEGIDVSGLLGMRLRFYYKEDDGIRTLVYYETEAGDNRTFRIDPEDLIGYENERLSYYKDGREQKIAVPGTAPVILNEVYKDVARGIDFLAFRDRVGEIVLLDSDGDNRIDAVLIQSYQTYQVKNVDLTGQRIFVRDVTRDEAISVEQENGREVYLSVDMEEDGRICRIRKDGKAAELSAIGTGSIISVAVSENTADDIVTTVLVSAKTAKGILSQRTEECLTVGETSYPLLPRVYLDAKAGMSGSFYLDAFGNIAAFLSGEGDYEYGYLIDAAQEGTFSASALLRVFTKKRAAVETFSIPDKIRVTDTYSNAQASADGSVEYVGVNKTPEEILAMLKPGGQLKRQLIAYRTEGGEITALCLARVYQDWNDTDDTVIPQPQPAGILSTRVTPDGTDGPGAPLSRKATRNQFPGFLVSSAASVFDLRSTNTAEWLIGTRDLIKDQVTYNNCSAYNLGAAGVADIVLMEPPAGAELTVTAGGISSLLPIDRYDGYYPTVVTGVSTGLNEAGETICTIQGFHNGSEKSYTVDNSADIELPDGAAPAPGDMVGDIVRIGDVWMFEADNSGALTRATRLLSGQTDFASAETYRRQQNPSQPDECDVALGRVREVGSNALLIAVSDVSDTHTMYKGKKLWPARLNQWGDTATKVTEYDVKKQTVTSKTAADIAIDDLVFTYCTYNVMQAVVIIRNYD